MLSPLWECWEHAAVPGNGTEPRALHDMLVLSFADSLITVTEIRMFLFCKQQQP